MGEVLIRTTADLPESTRADLRHMLEAAYDGDFDAHDWAHALGGTHCLIVDDGRVLCHVAIVPRRLTIGPRALSTGYVEAVATAKTHRGRGLASACMRAANAEIAERYDLGALCTGEHSFYERLGWRRWRGPTYVEHDGHLVPTPEEDDAIMVLATERSPKLKFTDSIACEPRPGDVW